MYKKSKLTLFLTPPLLYLLYLEKHFYSFTQGGPFMKHAYTLLLCITGFSIAQGAQNPNQTIIPEVTMAQQSLDSIITQANLDPIIAQALIAEVNALSQDATANLQQDIQDIRIAAAFTTLLEYTQNIAKSDPSISSFKPLISGLKYASHANVAKTLLLGALPGQLKNTPYYTDPYTESIGFILNDYVCNIIITALITALAPTSFGKALGINPNSRKTALASRIASALTAYSSWLLQKKFIILPLLQSQNSSTNKHKCSKNSK